MVEKTHGKHCGCGINLNLLPSDWLQSRKTVV